MLLLPLLLATTTVVVLVAAATTNNVVGGGVQVGIMYEGWQAPAYFGRSLANELTVEDVIRSNGSHSMANMSTGMNSKSMMARTPAAETVSLTEAAMLMHMGHMHSL